MTTDRKFIVLQRSLTLKFMKMKFWKLLRLHLPTMGKIWSEEYGKVGQDG